MNGLTGAILCSLLAIACGIISIRQFKEKGFLFNNAYIWANKQEREALDKKNIIVNLGLYSLYVPRSFL